MARPLLPATLLAANLACMADQGTLGAPCDVGGDCEEGLLCDRHDGGGSCQRVHDDVDEPQALDCSVEMRDDVYALGLHRAGAWAEVEFLDAQPAPPERGDNTWTVRVLDGSGVARDDLEIVVEPYMPDHTHGSTVRCEVEPGDTPGTYVLSPLNLFMPGLWEVTVVIHAEDFGDDSVQFNFCVDP